MPTDGQFSEHMKETEDALWHPQSTAWPAGNRRLLLRTQLASESTQQALYLSKPPSYVKSHSSCDPLPLCAQVCEDAKAASVSSTSPGNKQRKSYPHTVLRIDAVYRYVRMCVYTHTQASSSLISLTSNFNKTGDQVEWYRCSSTPTSFRFPWSVW